MAVSSDSLRLAIVREDEVGVTPTTPAYDLVRTTGEGLTYNVNTTESDEIGGLNRGVKDNILTGAEVSGDINFELAKSVAFEFLLSASLGNRWANDPLTVPGSTTDNVYNASVRKTYTIEKTLELGTGGNYAHQRFTGCMVDTMNLSITPNEPITGTFSFIGNEMVTSTTEVVGSTYAAAGTSPIMTAPLVTGIQLLTPPGIDDTTGAVLGTPVAWMENSCVTGMDLNVNNNSRPINCIGTLGVTESVFGRFEGSASGSLYFNGNEPLDALIDQTEYAVVVTMTDEDGGSYEVTIPRATFSEASAPVGGTNTDVMVEFNMTVLEYQGDTYAVSMIITRDSAATAVALPSAASLTPKAATKPKKEE